MNRVVLTHAAPRVHELAEDLARRIAGLECLVLPSSALVSQMASVHARAIVARLAQFDLVVFVSPGAARTFAAGLEGWPSSVRTAVIGPGTADAVRTSLSPAEAPIEPQAPPYDAQALLDTPPFARPHDLSILVVRGETGRDDWIDELSRRGARVEVVHAYRTESLPFEPGALATLRHWLVENPRPLFVFASRSAADAVSAAFPASGSPGDPRGCTCRAVHPRIVERLVGQGWLHVALVGPGRDALAAAIESS